MNLRSAILSVSALLFFLPVFSQKSKYDVLLREIRTLSYFDSAALFQQGNAAIALGKKEKHPELECEVLVFYGNHFYYKTKIDEAKKYYRKAEAVAQKLGNRRYVNYSRVRLAYLQWDKGEIEEAEKIFLEILEESEESRHYVNIIECCNAMALSKSYQNKYKECMTFFLKGLKVAEEQNEEQYQAVLLNNIGLLKVNNKQYDAALADFTKAVEISERMKDERLTFHLYNNMALIFMDKGKMEDAKLQYEKIMSYAHKSNNPKEMGIAATNLSNIYNQQENFELASAYCDTAIFSFKENDYTLELTKGYLTKALVLMKIKKFNEAEKYVKLAQHLADSTGNLEDAIGIHLTMSNIYEAKGDIKSALTEYKEYRKLGDSLKELMNTKAVAELQSKYDKEKDQAEIQAKEKKNLELKNANLILEQKNAEKERYVFWSIACGVILIIGVGGYLYVSYNRKTRRQQQRFSQQLIHNIEVERNRIAKDLHDDIGQSLSAIRSGINMMKDGKITETSIADLDGSMSMVIEQTREISRNLYPAYLEKIGITRSVARLMEGIQNNTGLVCSFEIDPLVESLPVNILTHIYRIIQECVNNTIKHSGATALKLTVLSDKDDYQLIYQDNGKGIQKADLKNSGVGFMSIRERSRMINGELIVSDNSGRGFRLIINFNPAILKR